MPTCAGGVNTPPWRQSNAFQPRVVFTTPSQMQLRQMHMELYLPSRLLKRRPSLSRALSALYLAAGLLPLSLKEWCCKPAKHLPAGALLFLPRPHARGLHISPHSAGANSCWYPVRSALFDKGRQCCQRRRDTFLPKPNAKIVYVVSD